MDQLKLFGRRVRAVRKAAKVTQEETAEAAGLNSKYLGEIERGEKRPSFEAVLSLAKALRTTPAAFFEFNRVETDPKVLRRRIDSLLGQCTPQQLQQAYRLIKALLEP